MAERFANNFATTLSAGIDNATTTVLVAAAAPAALQNGEFRIVVDSEIMRVTAGQSSTSWTVERQAEGSSVAAHSSGAAVKHVLTAHSIKVQNEELWLTDPRVGVEMTRTDVDQGAKVQAAINLGLTSIDAAGVLRLNPGTVNMGSTQLTYSQANKVLHIVGCGAADNETSGSTLRWTTDAGTGAYAMRSVYGAYGVVWRDFTFMGPQLRNTYGSNMADMWGPRVDGRSMMAGVNSTGFKSGMFLSRDHHEAYFCRWRGNSFNLYLGDNVGGGGGDFWFIGVHLDGALKACVAVGTSHALANFTFIQGHSGFAPYGLYRFEEGLSQRFDPWLQGGDFIQHSWEACGNGVIFDEPGDGTITDVRFANVGQAGEPSFAWPGKTYPARGLWDVGSIDRIQVTGDIAPYVNLPQGIDKPWIYGVNQVSGVQCASAVYTGHTTFAESGHKLIVSPIIDDVSMGNPGTRGGRGINATVANTSENLARFDAVELTETGTIRKARNSNPYLGQVSAAATTGTSAFVLTNGAQGNWIRARVSENVTTGARLAVDTANPGNLKLASTLLGYDTVARALENITAGTDGQVKITHCQA